MKKKILWKIKGTHCKHFIVYWTTYGRVRLPFRRSSHSTSYCTPLPTPQWEWSWHCWLLTMELIVLYDSLMALKGTLSIDKIKKIEMSEGNCLKWLNYGKHTAYRHDPCTLLLINYGSHTGNESRIALLRKKPFTVDHCFLLTDWSKAFLKDSNGIRFLRFHILCGFTAHNMTKNKTIFQ
jgi:hypothetical protein